MAIQNPMPIFSTVTLMAPTLIAEGAIWGRIWAASGLLWMTTLAASLDLLISRTLTSVEGDEFPSADRLSMTLTLAHFSCSLLVVAALGDWTDLTLLEKLVVFTAAGLFMGQVSNSNAHELNDRMPMLPRSLPVMACVALYPRL